MDLDYFNCCIFYIKCLQSSRILCSPFNVPHWLFLIFLWSFAVVLLVIVALLFISFLWNLLVCVTTALKIWENKMGSEGSAVQLCICQLSCLLFSLSVFGRLAGTALPEVTQFILGLKFRFHVRQVHWTVLTDISPFLTQSIFLSCYQDWW